MSDKHEKKNTEHFKNRFTRRLDRVVTVLSYAIVLSALGLIAFPIAAIIHASGGRGVYAVEWSIAWRAMIVCALISAVLGVVSYAAAKTEERMSNRNRSGESSQEIE